MIHVERIVNSIFESNTFVVSYDGSSDIWLVDVGDMDKVLDILPPGADVKGVLLTHTHFDHIYGMNLLHKSFPRCRLYVSRYGKDDLYDDKKNFSRYSEQSITYDGKDVVEIDDGEILTIYPGIEVIAFVTQGHSESSMTYVLDNYVFTGDAYIPNVKIVTKLPGGNRMLAKQSLELILKLAKGRTVCAGHGEMELQ